jgi:hypothetical protein
LIPGGGMLTYDISNVALLEPGFPAVSPFNMSAGAHTVYAVFSGLNSNFTVNNATTPLTITKENADILYDSSNPAAIQVSSPGGSSGAFTLKIAIEDLFPDAGCSGGDCPGDIRLIGNTDVTMDLVPVGPGSTISHSPCANGYISGSGYSPLRTVDFCFSGVPVNTYSVVVTINNKYYTGSLEDVLTIYDPSLGFTTGGGWFYWPGTSEKTNFGYNMKYNKNRTNLQGNLLIIRHLPDGTIYKFKSNALGTLSLGTNPSVMPYGWATFTGKGTYLAPGWSSAVGNYTFTTYVEDNNQPGTGNDRLWIEVKNPSAAVVNALSLPKTPALKARTLNGGNIVVPHSNVKK